MKAFIVCLAIATVSVSALPEYYGNYQQQWPQQEQWSQQQQPQPQQWPQQQWPQQQWPQQEPQPELQPEQPQLAEKPQWGQEMQWQPYMPQPQPQPQPQEPQVYQYQPNMNADGYKIIPGIVDSRCPRTDDPKNPIHLPIRGDCGKFMKCYGGRAYEQSCPAGLEFGATVNRCDYPTLARCSISGW